MPKLPSFLFFCFNFYNLLSNVGEQNPPLYRSRRMKNKPPLPPKATPSHRQKHKKMQTAKSGNSGTTSSPPLESDQPKSSFPLSIEPEITYTFDGEFDTIETEAPETLLLEVIKPDFLELNTLIHEVVEPEEPQPYSPITSDPSHSLPLSQTKPPTIYLGPDGEPLPYRLMSIEEILQEEPRLSTPFPWSRLHFYQTSPLPPL